jgi:hypothetical protein
VLTPEGARAWGLCRDADMLTAMESEEFVARPAAIAPDGTLTF